MNQKEFEAKLKQLPVVEPDQMDQDMLAEAEALNDGSSSELEAFKASLEEYSGKLVPRIPRSLHKRLKEQAAVEGVSLNQYMLYKLSN